MLNKKIKDCGEPHAENTVSVRAPAPTAAVAPVEDKSNHRLAAWELVQEGSIAMNPEELKLFLSNMGVDNLATFVYLVEDAEMLAQLNNMLKPMKKRELADLLKAT